MILNVSGRCDIVAFYTKWFMNRYNEGFVDVRNPFNRKFVSRIYFSDVDLILFCTKNPLPIIPYLKNIKKPIIFHITITPYKKEIEPGVISKIKIINGVKEISKIIGIENVYVRYDPIFLSDKYDINYHIKAFNKLCFLLDGFIDIKKNVINNKNILKYKEFTENDYESIGINFSRIANKYKMTVGTCFEKYNLIEYGFIKHECISHELAFKLTGKTYKNWNARREKLCNCCEMVDIGVYNCCNHLCKYCYANYLEKEVFDNIKKHDDNSSLLIGKLEFDDIIKIRKK